MEKGFFKISKMKYVAIFWSEELKMTICGNINGDAFATYEEAQKFIKENEAPGEQCRVVQLATFV